MITVHTGIFFRGNHDDEVEPTRQRDMINIEKNEDEDEYASGYEKQTIRESIRI